MHQMEAKLLRSIKIKKKSFFCEETISEKKTVKGNDMSIFCLEKARGQGSFQELIEVVKMKFKG